MKKKKIIQTFIGSLLLTAVVVIECMIFQPSVNSKPIELKNTLELVGSDIMPAAPKPVQALNEEFFTLSPETTQTSDESQYDPKSQKEYPLGAFTLHINNEEISIAYGVDEATLKQTPGWLENSAYPGEDGVCVIYGHRNRNHLRALKDVKPGDVIIIETDAADFCYRIENIEIMDSEDELTIPVLNGQYLMLTTCYPFYYSGSAPQKCVVMAKQNLSP